MASLEDMLRGSIWAQKLTPPEIDQVCSESREKCVAAGASLIRTGDEGEFWPGILEGFCKMSVSTPDGRLSTFTSLGAGGWFGEGTLLKEGRWRYDVVAVRHTRIACVPRATFQRLVDTSLPFNRFLMSHLNARLSMFISLVEYDRLHYPDARVARCLASLFDPDLYPQAGRFIQLSQIEIGLLAAVSRQRAHAALHALEKAGLLRIEFGGVSVLDLEGLRGYWGEAEGRHILKTQGGARRLAELD